MHKLLGLLVLASLCLLGHIAAQRCAYCTGKTCGPDGIGGSCGNCSIGQICVRGVCTCDRGCTGKECGSDNCGTLCGTCLPGQTCNNGVCAGACTPQCTRADGTIRTCGWDRCNANGRCGTCPNSDTCNFRCRDGTCECVPNCNNKHCGDDGCGGSCGTCQGGAICQGAADPFPNQCYFNCHVEIRVEVRELKTNILVNENCTVSVTGPNAFSAPNQVYPGPNPGYFSLDVSLGKYGTYQFATNCPGYVPDVETHTVNVTGQLVTLLVDWNPIQIEVRDQNTKQLLPTATIQISSGSYSLTVNWISPIYTWNHNGFKTYTFITSSPGYVTRTVSITVDYTTTLITLYLSLSGIPIQVVECVSGAAVNQATITTGTTTITYSGGATFTPSNGFTSYTFTTAATNYVSNTQSVAVSSTTTLITLCVNYHPVTVVVTDCATQQTINGAAIVVTNAAYASYSSSFTYSSSGTTWTPVGFSGTYIFATSAAQYSSLNSSQVVTPATNTISICLTALAFCGDGVCSGLESAVPTSANRCFDCGRLRGVISLAVGQKDQLVNMTISVWADPVNPAIYLRNGQTVPAPAFTTLSDSKGFFSINVLSFDAGVNTRAQGQAVRRFYFSLSGQYTDRTSGTDQVITLLPLWWNYQLTNKQWGGSGTLVGTNNSPSFYFYMTPPFTTSDSLIRVILSWGTLISDPSNSVPDLDLVVAGPVDPQSITVFGTGIINFQNKDLHSSNQILPYAKLVTDSAQGYGPEVFDFYGVPGQIKIGFSETYAPQAAANAYEVWIDRPNSSPNQDSATIFLYDTNSFIVVYNADIGNGNKQYLFDQDTGVPFAYGFYNTDQWNQVPTTATIWHILDLSQVAQGFVFHGFPGENNTADTTPYAGAKYGYDAQFFELTKSIPCGHTASRGANPAYCPATLTYPQVKK